jgi:hypothetical protein
MDLPINSPTHRIGAVIAVAVGVMGKPTYFLDEMGLPPTQQVCQSIDQVRVTAVVTVTSHCFVSTVIERRRLCLVYIVNTCIFCIYLYIAVATVELRAYRWCHG